MDDLHFFNIFRVLLRSVNNKKDAFELYDVYNSKVSCKYKNIMKSMINSIHFSSKTISLFEFKQILEKLNKIQFRDDCRKYIKNIFDNTDDEIQRSSIMRIISSKQPRINKSNNKNKIKIIKNCPHCNKVFISNNLTTYVICGYNNRGFDWKGCGKDWCFRCGKKLCKNWQNNNLFNTGNRYHTDKCCKKMAIKNNENINNYCLCSKAFINHKI